MNRIPRKKTRKKKVFSKRFAPSPGELYSKIEVSRDIFKTQTEELEKIKKPPYVEFLRRVYSFAPSLGKGTEYNEDYKNAIEFLGWDLKPEEFNASTRILFFAFLFLSMFFVVIFLNLLKDFISENPLFGYVFLFGPIIVGLYFFYSVYTYPLKAVKDEQKKALGYIPEIVSYLIMSLKLTPNLEKAIEFTAENGKGKIAYDFKRMLWEVELGLYNNIYEGLDVIAYRWGKYSPEFKRALMRIRASVLEDNEQKRHFALDKAMEELLEAVKEKMEAYARGLKQPATTLFYIGVLLPIILIIMIPLTAAGGLPFGQPLFIAFIYNFLIPFVFYMYAKRLLIQRPPTYEPPKITYDHPEVPKKWLIPTKSGKIDLRHVLIAVAIFGITISWFLHAYGLPPKSEEPLKIGGFQIGVGLDKPQLIPKDQLKSEVMKLNNLQENYFTLEGRRGQQILRQLRTDNPALSDEQLKKEAELMLCGEERLFFLKKNSAGSNDITPMNLIAGLLLTIAIMLHLYLKYSVVFLKRVQDKIIEMENEFKDTLYVIASRMGENRPVEDAMNHVKEFLPTYLVSERIYGRTLDNIKLMGMPLEPAIFDSRYGALANIPSKTLSIGMKVLVDSVQLGVNVAARTLVSLSLQMDNTQKVNQKLKELVFDVLVMMSTLGVIIAPLVLGAITGFYKIIVQGFGQLGSSAIGNADFSNLEGVSGFENVSGLTDITSFFSTQNICKMATPELMLAVVSLYIVELVILITYFSTKIEEDNDLLVKTRLSQTIPVAVTLFIIALYVVRLLV